MSVGAPFAKQLEAFALKVEGRGNDAIGRIVTAIVAKVDARSPVGNQELWLYNRGTSDNPDYVHWLAYNDPNGYVGGHFRANWQLGLDNVPGGIVSEIDPNGSETVAKNLAVIPEEASGHVFSLVNNLPYAIPLENGWSTQAPSGMVGLTVREFQSIVDESVAEAKAAHP